jgi:deoxyribonuclease-4
MLVGAHVSTAGGLANAYQRGVDMGCDAIQIFNQSPRMWRPTKYTEENFAEMRELMAGGPVKSVTIHAVYLINAATKDKEIRKKSLDSLVHALRVGDGIGAEGVVFHPGSQLKEPLDEALGRVGEAIKHALGESDKTPLLLENTAGAGGTLGRSFAELGRLIELGGGHKRIGLCLDSCHMLASGFDIATEQGLTKVLDECVDSIDIERVRVLHVNDSKVPVGANVDRHERLGEGYLGPKGIAAFMSEPRFEGRPALFEGAGAAPNAEDVQRLRDFRKKGLAARKRSAAARKRRAA